MWPIVPYRFCYLSVSGRYSVAMTLLLAASRCAAGFTTAEELELAWRSQQTDVVSAKVSFKRFFTGSRFLMVSPEQFKRLFERSALAAEPESYYISEVIPRLFEKPPANQAVGYAAPKDGQLVLLGDLARESNWVGDHVVTSRAEVTTDGADRMVSLFTPGACPLKLFSIKDLRYVPEAGDLVLTEASPPALNFRINRGPTQEFLLVDEQTTIVMESTKFDDSGLVHQITLQDAGVEFADGIVFPKWTVRAWFSGIPRTIDRFEIIFITDAAFNLEIPPEMFRVKATKGDRIVDYRSSLTEPRVFICPGDVDDITDLTTNDEGDVISLTGTFPLLTHESPPAPGAGRTPGFSYWGYMLGMNGLLLVFIVLSIYRRYGGRSNRK